MVDSIVHLHICHWTGDPYQLYEWGQWHSEREERTSEQKLQLEQCLAVSKASVTGDKIFHSFSRFVLHNAERDQNQDFQGILSSCGFPAHFVRWTGLVSVSGGIWTGAWAGKVFEMMPPPPLSPILFEVCRPNEETTKVGLVTIRSSPAGRGSERTVLWNWHVLYFRCCGMFRRRDARWICIGEPPPANTSSTSSTSTKTCTAATSAFSSLWNGEFRWKKSFLPRSFLCARFASVSPQECTKNCRSNWVTRVKSEHQSQLCSSWFWPSCKWIVDTRRFNFHRTVARLYVCVQLRNSWLSWFQSPSLKLIAWCVLTWKSVCFHWTLKTFLGSRKGSLALDCRKWFLLKGDGRIRSLLYEDLSSGFTRKNPTQVVSLETVLSKVWCFPIL